MWKYVIQDFVSFSRVITWIIKTIITKNDIRPYKIGFIQGAKWQQERSYSEEDLREAFKQSRQALIFEKDMPPVYENFEEWFNQFKNK